MSERFVRGYGVVVGVGADLPVTVEDATAVAELLRDPGRCAYPAEQVRLLTGKEASREGVLAALDWLAGAAGADTTALVYFSGHGLETPTYYLMPFGTDLADLGNTAITGGEFTERLRAIRAKKLLVLLDCCHAGGQAQAKALPGVKSPLPPETAAELERGSGRVVIASSRKDEVSWTGRPYSVFTAALLEGLAGYGAFERDGYARVLDVALYVGRMVPNRTADQQHPIVKVANLEDNYPVAYYAAGEEAPKEMEWARGVPESSTEPETAQMASWRRMLANRREALMLIEERMSEYVAYQEIPLQLIKNKRGTEERIAELERKLGLRS